MIEALEVEVGAASVLLAFRNGVKRMGYAVSNALRSTILAVQTAERGRVRSEFHLRRPDFVLREAAIIRFPSPNNWVASAHVGTKPRFLLAGFETGEPRRPFVGKRVAVPLIGGPARPSFTQPVPPTLLFKALDLKRMSSRGLRRRRGKLGTPAPQFKGLQRTFEIQSSTRQPEGGVFQRVAAGPSGIRLVYPFVASPKPLDRRLRFIPTARAVAFSVFPTYLKTEIVSTINFQLARGLASVAA